MTCSDEQDTDQTVYHRSDIRDMDALIQKLERSVARLGDVDHESLNDTAKKQGTSLDPPLYDCRTLFAMFTGNDRSKRVVDIDQIWCDAQTQQNGKDDKKSSDDGTQKKLQRIKNHSRHVRKAASTNALVLEHISKQKNIIKRANSHPSLRSSQQSARPATRIGRISTAANFDSPVSYHGFIARKMKTASWDAATLSPPAGDQSIGILKEIYEIR